MMTSGVRHVDRALYRGTIEATLAEKVFCSHYWQTVCCQEIETADGAQVRIDPNVYPPGGPHHTSMRRCRACGKWAPPGPGSEHQVEPTTATCVDCEIEQSHAMFQSRMRHLYRVTGDEEFIRTITALYWKRHHIRPETPDEERARLKRERLAAAERRRERARGNGKDEDETEKFDLSALLYDGIHDRLNESVSVDSAVFAEQQTTSGQHWLAEALDMTERPATHQRFSDVCKLIREHLAWVGKDDTRRATGCSKVLLGESEEALRREIDYLHAKRSIVPSARRVSNPYDRREQPLPMPGEGHVL